MKIGFDGCNNQVVTFLASGDITVGTPVKLVSNGTVAPAANGDEFIGMAVNVDKNYVGVCISGFVTAKCTNSTVTAGLTGLVAATNGGVTKGDSKLSRFVVDKDTANQTVTFIL